MAAAQNPLATTSFAGAQDVCSPMAGSAPHIPRTPMTVAALKRSLGRHRRRLACVLGVLAVLVAVLAAAEIMLGNTVYPV